MKNVAENCKTALSRVSKLFLLVIKRMSMNNEAEVYYHILGFSKKKNCILRVEDIDFFFGVDSLRFPVEYTTTLRPLWSFWKFSTDTP